MFGFIVASVHGRFKMDRAAQTERIIRAVSNPYTTILGHMTGRQLLRRPGYDIDIEKVLAASAEHGAARKTWFRYRRFCRRADCSIAIVSTDIGSDKAGVARADILRQIRVLLHRSEDPHDKVSHDFGSAHRNRVLVALCAIKSPGRRSSHHRRPGSGPAWKPRPHCPGRDARGSRLPRGLAARPGRQNASTTQGRIGYVRGRPASFRRYQLSWNRRANSPRQLLRMSNTDAGHERWRRRVAVAVVVSIIVIALVMIRAVL